MFCTSAENAATLQAERSKSEVYYYYFNYIGEEKESDTESFTGSKEKLGKYKMLEVSTLISNILRYIILII